MKKIDLGGDMNIHIAGRGRMGTKLKRYLGEHHTLTEPEEAEMVIEAKKEDLKIKQEFFREMEERVGNHVLLGTCTSSLRIKDIFDNISDKSRCIGVHFFNPPHKMRLVELTLLDQTEPRTLKPLDDLLSPLDKTVIECEDTPGFIVNRILNAILKEARSLEEEGYEREDIDKAVTDGLNHPMGPFELENYIGEELCCIIRKNLEATNAPQE